MAHSHAEVEGIQRSNGLTDVPRNYAHSSSAELAVKVATDVNKGVQGSGNTQVSIQ